MANLTKFDEIRSTFNEAFSMSIAKNEHLKLPCLLSLLSIVNKVTYPFGSDDVRIKMSTFKVQQSGTGKGMTDKFMLKCVKYLGFKGCKIIDFTEAGLVGSMEKHPATKEDIVINGYFKDYDFLWVDEGKKIIDANSHSVGLLTTLNGVLDDGIVHKRMKNGTIEYRSNSVLGVGTFFLEKLKLEILKTGFFQRCLFTYVDTTHEDVMETSIAIRDLYNKERKDVSKVLKKLKELVHSIDLEKYRYNYISCGKEMYKYQTTIDKTLLDDYFKITRQWYGKICYGMFNNPKLKTTLDTFLHRYRTLGINSMVLRAVCNGEDQVGRSNLSIGVEVFKNQFKFIVKFIEDAFESMKFDDDDLMRFDLKKKGMDDTKKHIVLAIRNNPKITKTELCEHAKKNPIKFKVGLNKLRKQLRELIDEEKIETKVGSKNRTELFVKNNEEQEK